MVEPQSTMTDQQLGELLSDIGEEFGKLGKIADKFIVQQGKAIPGGNSIKILHKLIFGNSRGWYCVYYI